MTAERQSPIEPAAEVDPAAVFRDLAELVYDGEDRSEMHQALCDAALALVDGCDHASIMLESNGRIRTAAATDHVARRIDELEHEIGEGPCVDAIYEEAAQLDTDLSTECTWPRLGERIVEETPVRSMAGFRLLVDNRKVGALNLFSDRPYGLTGRSVDQAALLAAFASVSLMASARKEQAETLREGLESNRAIGKAIGLMMAFHKVTDDDAFELLRKASQDMNLKLRDVAGQVVHHHNQRPKT